jgi:hypothetical protein
MSGRLGTYDRMTPYRDIKDPVNINGITFCMVAATAATHGLFTNLFIVGAKELLNQLINFFMLNLRFII